MNRRSVLATVTTLTLLAMAGAASAPAEAESATQTAPELTPDEQLAAAAAECEAAREDFALRAAESSLYDRLGGRDGIHAIFVNLVGMLASDPAASAMFEGVDRERLIEVSTDHLAAHTGGSEVYSGRDITEVHKPLNIDARMFLDAGAAFGAAMEQAGVAPEVAQETMCVMIGMSGQVLAAGSAGG